MTWAAAALSAALGLGACVTLYRAIDRPRPGRIAVAAVLLVSHCSWALLVVLVIAPDR